MLLSTTKNATVIIIPARMNSYRLPNKPLINMAGKPLLKRTYEQASKCRVADGVYVATDDKEISDYCNENRLHWIHTGSDPIANGSLRCLKAVEELQKNRPPNNIKTVVNWQVDEPLVRPEAVDFAINMSRNSKMITTLVAIDGENDDVRVIVGESTGYCHWFSRVNMPTSLHHCGLYVFPLRELELIKQFRISESSKLESLEQLTWIENGIKINAVVMPKCPLAINNQNDVDKYRKLLNEH